MWPWELKTFWGHGIAHSLEVAEWYINAYPVQFIVSVLCVFLLICATTAAAALIARRLFAEPDPAKHLFGTLRTAKREGKVR